MSGAQPTAPAFQEQLRSMPMLELLQTINERANVEGIDPYLIIRRGYLYPENEQK